MELGVWLFIYLFQLIMPSQIFVYSTGGVREQQQPPGAGGDFKDALLRVHWLTFCYRSTFLKTRSSRRPWKPFACLSAALRSGKFPLKRSVAQASFPWQWNNLTAQSCWDVFAFRNNELQCHFIECVIISLKKIFFLIIYSINIQEPWTYESFCFIKASSQLELYLG